ncbi:M14 family metallopeptidase [Paraliomyxa miuraensis]|uniref:succinylglutamate desuccinylase/aspartoacylase domain-containing protein n=1 Tax=Paraliomyxa miuraensis TaxID=376150 RepID=UPI0022545186|nr:succinylglutamate desuccinylase/aspartoacylase family protein [Paraliomyxa miuraensis]MCX4247309.1 succinylglutamate desuccinylase/aspartoacylase family protein [Paraliomyxa miuraensis]
MPLTPGVHWFSPTLPLHVFDADEPGPTALVQAGIHGDEVAGVHALQELLEEEIRPTHGRLIVVPVMNPPAYRARQRMVPGGLDLNRCFPGDAEAPERERRLARRFMDLVEDERPALMVTLHESHKRYDPAVVPSFGQTIVVGVEPRPAIVDRVLARLNERFTGEGEHWDPQYYPVATSSTEVIVDAIGCVGLCIETWMGFEEARRIEMQRAVVEYLLDDVGVRRI